MDFDGLKHINDSEGHVAGDRALLQLVEGLRRALRTLDGVYRLGGDEFVVVLPDTSIDGAEVVMARVERLGAPSFSWGVASVQSTGGVDAALLMSAADDTLYERRRRDPGSRLAVVRARPPATSRNCRRFRPPSVGPSPTSPRPRRHSRQRQRGRNRPQFAGSGFDRTAAEDGFEQSALHSLERKGLDQRSPSGEHLGGIEQVGGEIEEAFTGDAGDPASTATLLIGSLSQVHTLSRQGQGRRVSSTARRRHELLDDAMHPSEVAHLETCR